MPVRYLLTMTVKGHMMAGMSEPTMTRTGIPEWTLGWRLKRALSFADLTAQDMAAELGVHVGTISRWMNDREHPRRAYLMAWSLRCGVPFGWLVGTEPDAPVTDPATNADIPSGMSGDLGPPSTLELRTRLRKRIPLTPDLYVSAVAA